MTAKATIGATVADAARRLDAEGIENARGEARLLLSHVLGIGAEKVIGHPEFEIDDDGMTKFETALRRRERREPMSHVLGAREFWSLNFRVTPDTLDPRPDSETIVEAVLDHIGVRGQRLRVLDLGAGTGCLLLAILSELPNATGVGIDISPAALHIAKENAVTLGLDQRADFHRAEWDFGLAGEFDVIVSNPPYIPTGDLAMLQPEIALFEPHLALDGGIDGLAEYRALAPVFSCRLRNSGFAVVELGAGQSDAVERIMTRAGLEIIGRRFDLGGVARCLMLRHATALTNR